MAPVRSPSVLRVQVWTLLLVMLATVGWVVGSSHPPSPVSRSAPVTVFSSGRAMDHVAILAARPHPMGTAAHAEARRYLVQTLGAWGLAPSVQEATVEVSMDTPRVGQGARVATVRNILARIPGTGKGPALLLSAHYDTCRTTPGAADDSMGVATLLETARALRASPPLPRDVILLITDGEEEGLFGARAFVAQHPWAHEVALVLNFEARGNRGQVLMFQTSESNGELIRELARAAPYVVATSLSDEVYRRMPNSTDLSVWLPRTPGLNFANIDGVEHYHAPSDTVAQLDERTLQHHGSYALALARAFGARTLPVPPAPDATYFNVGAHFVHYPAAWRWSFVSVGVLLVGAFLRVGMRRGAMRPCGVVLATWAVPAALALAALVGHAAWSLAAWLRPGSVSLNIAQPTSKQLFFVAFLTAGLASSAVLPACFAHLLRRAELLAGASVAWAILALTSAVWLPGSAYLFVWPQIFATALGLGMLATAFLDDDRLLSEVLRAALPVPAVGMLLSFAILLYAAFGPSAAAWVGGIGALAGAFGVPAVFGVSATKFVQAPYRRALLLGAWAVAAMLFAAALALAEPRA